MSLEEGCEFQSGTSFPGDNSKHIDYVIKYIEKDNIENDEKEQTKTKFCAVFFEKLEKEDFQIYTLRPDKGNEVYALLNCSLQRLKREADEVEPELIKSVNFNNFLNEFISMKH